MINAISIDLEDWYCANNVTRVVRRENWVRCESRVESTTRRLLALFDKHRTRATFFVLGWIAERHPALIREIQQRGHEIGVHGYFHLLLTEITPPQFETDLARALETLDRCGVAQTVIGFRAPSFTVVKKTEWAFEILQKYRIRYDTSVFPVALHPDYGVGSAPLTPYRISDRLVEFPMSCLEIAGMRVPFGGGAYFRLLPYRFTRFCIQRCNGAQRPMIFYLHPWELDPGQPRVELPWYNKVRHYYNLHKTERRLELLLRDFRFTTVREVLNL